MDDDDMSVISEWDIKSDNAHIESHDDENVLLNTGNLLSDLKDEEIDFNLNDISSISHKITTTNKTKFIENVQEKFNDYFKNFFDNFKNKNLDKLIDNYKETYEKLNKKLIDSQTNYIKQEKEPLSLLIRDVDKEYKKQIDEMVKQLKDEREKEKNKFNKEYFDRLEKINKKIIDENITKNKDNEILQEKLKLELTNLLTENIK
jgi:exonuclease VII large subunit